MKKAEIARKIQKVLAGTQARLVYLFGSHARDEADSMSDIDLAVIADSNLPFVDRFRDYTELWTVLGTPVELFIYTPAEWTRMQDEGNPFIERIIEEGTLVYERRES